MHAGVAAARRGQAGGGRARDAQGHLRKGHAGGRGPPDWGRVLALEAIGGSAGPHMVAKWPLVASLGPPGLPPGGAEQRAERRRASFPAWR